MCFTQSNNFQTRTCISFQHQGNVIYKRLFIRQMFGRIMHNISKESSGFNSNMLYNIFKCMIVLVWSVGGDGYF